MSNESKICIGIFFRNEEKYLKKAIQSILNQSHIDFKLILLNDASTDKSLSIAENFKDQDDRISIISNTYRKGYSHSYRDTFNFYGSKSDFFAWASGHDIHHKEWLSNMLQAMLEDKDIAIVYPLNDRINKNDNYIRDENIYFHATSKYIILRLIRVFFYGRGFGNIIYGLFRSDHLRKCGIYRKVLVADTVLIFEMLLLGKIKQVNKILWHRRFDYFTSSNKKMIKDMTLRQKNNMFSTKPWYINMPWPFVNSYIILYKWIFNKNFNLKLKFFGTLASIFYLLKYLRLRNL